MSAWRVQFDDYDRQLGKLVVDNFDELNLEGRYKMLDGLHSLPHRAMIKDLMSPRYPSLLAQIEVEIDLPDGSVAVVVLTDRASALEARLPSHSAAELSHRRALQCDGATP